MKFLEEMCTRASLIVRLADPAAPSQPPQGQISMSVQGAKAGPIVHRSGYWIFLDLAPGSRTLSWQAEHHQDGQQVVTVGPPSAPAPIVRIVATLPPPVSITLASLTQGHLGKPYQKPVSTSGGKAPLTFEATGLPAGLSIDRVTGMIAGTPRAKGKSPVTVNVKDHNATRDGKTYSLAIVT